MFRPTLRPVPAIMVGIVIAAALTGCASSTPAPAADPGTSAPEPVVEVTEAAPTAASTAPSSTSANDVCALVTEAEVAGVIGEATVDTALSFGGLTEEFGGQCVWAAKAGALNLELAAWPAGGTMNPPPAEAPAPGSGGFVAVDGGAYYATATHSFRLAVTDTGALDPTLTAPVQQLARELQARG